MVNIIVDISYPHDVHLFLFSFFPFSFLPFFVLGRRFSCVLFESRTEIA